MSKHHSGFAHEILLVGMVVLVAIGAAGYYVYANTSKKSNNSMDSTAEPTAKVEPLSGSLKDLKTIDEIRALANDKLSGSTITAVDVEQNGDSVVYKLKLSDRSYLMYNAKTGEFISQKRQDDTRSEGSNKSVSASPSPTNSSKKSPAKTPESEDKSESEKDEDIPAIAKTDISVDQARTIALQQRPGKTIKKIELDNDGGNLYYSVRFTDSGRVDINATTGAVIKVEKGDEDK